MTAAQLQNLGGPSMTAHVKQHLIDPETCIRCNTCEETCPVDAIAHDANNYVVKPEICQQCMKCIVPCPTGAIDNWRVVTRTFGIDEQYTWKVLPPQTAAEEPAPGGHVQALEDDVGAILDEAHRGLGGSARPPASASKPSVNLFNRAAPARPTVVGNFRLTDAATEHDIRHVILDFGTTPLPFLEGQSIGVIPPGTDHSGKSHTVRLYSIASPRDGEKPNANNLALTVKRVPGGVGSNYVCDLEKGATVEVTGPFGATFLYPDDPTANLLMICTGTGSAPFRGFIGRRRRVAPTAPGRLMLFFGARRPEELPYFGPLQTVPTTFLTRELCFSRVPSQPKTYVQDAIRRSAAPVADLIRDPATHVFLCGLKAMEGGVDEAFRTVCDGASLDWAGLRSTMRSEGRLQIETY